jgi:TolB-like protein
MRPESIVGGCHRLIGFGGRSMLVFLAAKSRATMATEGHIPSPNDAPTSNDGEAVLVQPTPATLPDPPHGSSGLWERIKRHKVVEWTLAYAAFAFALLHATTLLSDALEWPHLIVRSLTLILVVGLPVAPILAWYHGVRALRRVSAAELILIALLLAIGGTLLWRYPRAAPERTVAAATGGNLAAAKTEHEAAAAFAPPAHSVAVLPFTNLSGDPKQEYFSDGMSEELINALVHVEALRVTARTSSFSFKGESVDIGTIARKLNVAAILEGSVRRSGNTVRITAQLINTVSGVHMWSEDYDRDLKNALALQTDIATTVAQQLEARLLGDEAAKIGAGGTKNPEAYDAYLRGVQQSNFYERDVDAALPALDQAIKLDPNYAAAYAMRARLLQDEYIYETNRGSRARLPEQIRLAAEHAVMLAPQMGAAHLEMARYYLFSKFDFQSAAREYDLALQLSPGSAYLQEQYALFQAQLGHFDSAIAAGRRGVALDPEDAFVHAALSVVLKVARRYDEALKVARDGIALNPSTTVELPESLVASHQYDAARELCENPHSPLGEDNRHFCLALAYHGLGKLDKARTETRLLANRLDTDGGFVRFHLAGVYAQLGDAGASLRTLVIAESMRDPLLGWIKFNWMFDPIRNEPQYQAIVTRMNFPP